MGKNKGFIAAVRLRALHVSLDMSSKRTAVYTVYCRARFVEKFAVSTSQIADSTTFSSILFAPT